MGSAAADESGILGPWTDRGRVLIVIASQLEAGGIAPLRPGLDLVVTGVGKANAAATTAAILAGASSAAPVVAVLNVGICGALPPPQPHPQALPLTSVVLATMSRFGDEGVRIPDGFLTLGSLGFAAPGLDDSFTADPGLRAALGTIADATGTIATVSSCSGTDAEARAVAGRTGAVAEAMEGTAAALAAARAGAPFAEVRVVSNTTGDRDRQQWALRPALDRLAHVIARL